jgi:O-antigen/teichoic acid export membrane protein
MAHDPASFSLSVRRGIRTALAVGIPAAVALALGAHLALSVLGPHYAGEGAAPLRILVLAVLPMAFVQAYFASCRARRALNEAIIAGWACALASVGAAMAAGATYGLVGMAVAWVLVQYATGLWSFVRLRSLRDRADGARATHPAHPALSPSAATSSP